MVLVAELDCTVGVATLLKTTADPPRLAKVFDCTVGL